MSKPNQKKQAPNIFQAEEWQQRRILMLLANLCYVPYTEEELEMGLEQLPMNRLGDMGDYRITPEVIELCGMPEEARFMDALLALLGQKLPPTFENVQDTLAYVIGSPEQAEEITNRVRAHRSIDGDVGSMAFAIGEWMKVKYLAHTLRTLASDTVEGAYGTYFEKFEQVIGKISSLAPISQQRRTASYDALWEKIQDYAIKAVERRNEGKVMGPQYPTKKLNQMVRGGMEKGDVHLWTGGTKAGKTQMANWIGRHIAFNQEDFLVLMLHLETNQVTLAMREVCAEFKVKPGDIREGLIDPREEPWKTRFAKAKARIAAKCGAGEECRYWYEHCPGLTIQEFEVFVRQYLAKAEAQNRELVVILDYYQEMDWSTLPNVQNEAGGLNMMATKIKEIADDYGIYVILFAQEVDDESDKKGRTTPYGAKKIVKRAQAHFRILRGLSDDKPLATSDMPVEQYENGEIVRDEWGRVVPRKDGMGNDMYWQLEGQPAAMTRIHLCRGNNVDTGIAWVMVMNGYFVIAEAAPPEK